MTPGGRKLDGRKGFPWAGYLGPACGLRDGRASGTRRHRQRLIFILFFSTFGRKFCKVFDENIKFVQVISQILG